jgi:predicted SprT family Zn-dependent metalloprotease
MDNTKLIEKITLMVNQCNQEMSQLLNHELVDVDLYFGHALQTAGLCSRYSNVYSKITISLTCASLEEDDAIKNTIIHELCHAYNDRNDGHGYYWKQIAKKASNYFGTKITRCFVPTDAQMMAYEKNKNKIKRKPVALVEVPEINWKRYIYRRDKGYYHSYKNYTVKIEGKQYYLKFTKLA